MSGTILGSPLFFETRFLTGISRLDRQASEPQASSLSLHPQFRDHKQASPRCLFISDGGLGNQTQVLVIVLQALLLAEVLPRPTFVL